MPSPMGLLEDRELTARQRLEECREEAERAAAALAEAEQACERAVIAKEEFAAALAEARAADDPPSEGAQAAAAAAPGTIVPERRPGVEPAVLAPDYQRIIGALEAAAREGAGPLNCRQIAARLGWETSAAGVERVRAKARRMAERGWLVKEPDGRFSASVRPGGGS
ncbi:hypothetical protein [Streptomyces brasiliensis]|nr:hypothetical protein [Streptomyces brasiliensis]